MKKFSFFLNCAASAMFAIALTACSAKEDNPTGFDPSLKDVTIQSGDTLAPIVDQMAAYTNDILLEIPAGVDTVYTGDITLDPGKTLAIIGDEKNPPVVMSTNSILFSSDLLFKDVTISGKENKNPIIKINTTSTDVFTIDYIVFNNVIVDSLQAQLFYANKKKVVVNNFAVENCIIAIKGATKKTIFDFNGGGLPNHFSVNNSTICADDKTTWANGGFYSTQAGSKMDEVNVDSIVISIKNSILYNICKGFNLSSLRQNSAKTQKYIVTNNVFADCGKFDANKDQTQAMVGLNNGAAGNDYNWDVDHNVIMRNGQFYTEKKIGKTEGLIKNSVPVNPQYKDAAKGNFRPTNVLFLNLETIPGDPRWVDWVNRYKKN